MGTRLPNEMISSECVFQLCKLHNYARCLWCARGHALKGHHGGHTCHKFRYTFSFPCTCMRIFKRSIGATAVRDLQVARGVLDLRSLVITSNQVNEPSGENIHSTGYTSR
jgi:hypothetical protein